MNYTLEELKLQIAARMSIEEVLDICDISIHQLLDALEEYIEENQGALEDAL